MGLRRIRVALDLERESTSKVLSRSKAIHAALTAHPEMFLSLPIPLATFGGQIKDLDTAHQTAGTGLKGAASMRDTKSAIVCSSIEVYGGYVQTLADADPDTAVATIEAAAFRVAQSTNGQRYKPLLDATVTGPGAVALRANASQLHEGGGKCCFHWQQSLDGGQTWTDLPATAGARTTVTGLPVMTVVWFRVSISTLKGHEPWTQPVSVAVTG